MIGRLRGILVSKSAPQLLLEVNGVGYEIDAPMSTFYELPDTGKEVTLHTHLVVREDNHTLFGFARESERTLFRTLIKVNGVGARLALTILSGISSNEFVRCVEQDDTVTLTRLPGIGKKTAERLIVEMRDRIKDWAISGTSDGATASGRANISAVTPVEDAVSALITLGYKPQEASRMVRSVDNSTELVSEDIIRLALQGAVQ